MKYTLSDCIITINQVLNYPSLSYEDVSHFFDQAISEINSELNIGLRPISEIYKESSLKLEDLGDAIILSSAPNYEITTDTTADVYFNRELGQIMYKTGSEYKSTSKLYGMLPGYAGDTVNNQIWQTVFLNNNAYWTPYESVPSRNVDLTQYLPYDWIVLFLIPYVCFKYDIRDGGTGTIYADDFSNGFQQLRNSYDVPYFVNLSEQAGKKAYQHDIETHLPNINITIPTRAIYEDMKIGRSIRAVYGSMYDRGGWGF